MKEGLLVVHNYGCQFHHQTMIIIILGGCQVIWKLTFMVIQEIDILEAFLLFLTSNIFSLYIGRFGESSLYRIVKWLKSCEKITKSSLFLDIGCGNGILLVKLVCLP